MGHHEQLHRNFEGAYDESGSRGSGIAEALLATAIGLVAAIPAVVIYNMFTRSIGGYRLILGNASANVLRLASRDLDRGGMRLQQTTRQAAE